MPQMEVPSTCVCVCVCPLQCNVPTCDRLAYDTQIVDLHVTNRDNLPVSVNRVFDEQQREGILMDLPRTNASFYPLKGVDKSTHFEMESMYVEETSFSLYQAQRHHPGQCLQEPPNVPRDQR